MNRRYLVMGAVFVAVGLLALVAIACGDDDDEEEGAPTPGVTEEEEPAGASHSVILGDVQGRGELICGVNGTVAGFSFLEPDGTMSGFDADFCRAVAAAVLGDAEAVDFVQLTAAARFEALSAGEIDVLIRNTTWTQSRDADLNATFAVTTFYDGQGMMVRVGAFDSIDDMAGTTICVLKGTTTELNLEDRMAAAGLSYTPLTFDDNETLEPAFLEERCDGWTSDKSQLAARRLGFPADAGGPELAVILDETFSKEPLGPVTPDDDSQWFDVVNWVVIGMITADEKGITSGNIDDFIADPGDAETARLLGVSFEGGEISDLGLGIDTDFMQDVISQVGNYDEVYQKNIAPLGIPREGSLNASWLDGGLIYAPPTR